MADITKEVINNVQETKGFIQNDSLFLFRYINANYNKCVFLCDKHGNPAPEVKTKINSAYWDYNIGWNDKRIQETYLRVLKENNRIVNDPKRHSVLRSVSAVMTLISDTGIKCKKRAVRNDKKNWIVQLEKTAQQQNIKLNVKKSEVLFALLDRAEATNIPDAPLLLLAGMASDYTCLSNDDLTTLIKENMQ